MCLLHAIEIEHEEDIKCFKFLLRNIHTGKLSSPYFQGTDWKIGKTKAVKQPVSGEKPLIEARAMRPDKVDGFAYHTYAYLADATRSADIFGRVYNIGRPASYFRDYAMVVAECTIPKNSKFVYKGYEQGPGETTRLGYASEKLRIDRLVSLDENTGEIHLCSS